jgi:glycosyltransferase A (GT-A) superfamily protein (DUF2064 family)
MNRDLSLLITRIQGARASIDVGLALSSHADPVSYEPYKNAGFQVFYQKGKTETGKINSIFEASINRGYESVVLLSHSAPNLPLNYLENAFSDLRNGNSLVLGPSENSMFYLIGIKKKFYKKMYNHDIFRTISFANQSLRDTTLKTMKELCSECSILPNWYILKSLDDLKKLYIDSIQGIGWEAQWTHQITQGIIS